jgi:hypothetical protein
MQHFNGAILQNIEGPAYERLSCRNVLKHMGCWDWRAKTKAEVDNEDARKMPRQEHDCAHTEKRRREDD